MPSIAFRPSLAQRIAPYRGGYTAAQRQEIQRRLTAGELLGVVATDALELGIDIGELDAAICVTFPGTVASLKQMWGRAGRRGRGLAFYVAGEDALDQFFCRHPDEFIDRPVEAAIIDPHSPEIYAEHLLCAAHEAPLSDADEPILGEDWREHAEQLTAAGLLRERATGFVPMRADDYPAARVALRSASADSFALIDASIRRGARHDRGGARLCHDPRGRGLPAPGSLLPRARSSTSPAVAACSSDSTATTSPRPSGET